MINHSYLQRFIRSTTTWFAAVLLLTGSLGLPFMAPGITTADAPATVCQNTSIDPSDTLEAPTLLTPANDSTNPNGFDFSWTSVNGATQYDWESSSTADLNSDGSFMYPLAQHRLGTTAINEGNSPQATYYWHVRAVADDGTTSPWSQTWLSTIDDSKTSYLGAPTLTFPTNGATCNIYTQDFSFTWNAPVGDGGAGPLQYIFQSGRSATTDPSTGEFIDQPWSDAPISTTSIFDGGSQDGTYYWHIRAVGSDGTRGPWSDTWVVSITRQAPIQTPPADITDPTTPSPSDSDSTPPASTTDTTIASAASTSTSSISTATSSTGANNTRTNNSPSNDTILNLFSPAAQDVAAAVSTHATIASNQALPIAHHGAELAANIGSVHTGRSLRTASWIVALILALAAAIFAFRRRRATISK